jgi:hypothetical protein
MRVWAKQQKGYRRSAAAQAAAVPIARVCGAINVAKHMLHVHAHAHGYAHVRICTCACACAYPCGEDMEDGKTQDRMRLEACLRHVQDSKRRDRMGSEERRSEGSKDDQE